MHEANIGAQFWSRDEDNVTWNNAITSKKMFGAVDHKRHAAIIEMARDIEAHNVYHPDVELENSHQQGLLFDSVPATPWEVHALFAHEDMGHHVPALLGLAAAHSQRTSGTVPAATDDLSVHSKKVVDHLVKAKLLKNPIKKSRKWEPNPVTREDGGYYAGREGLGKQGRDRPVPTSDVVAASEGYRAAIRASRVPKAPKAPKVKTPDPRQAPLW